MDNTNIKLVRLQTGEDVIADLTMDTENDVVTLNNPMHVIFKRMSTGKVVMLMLPWLPLEIISENSANIYATDILTILEPKESLIDYYGNVVEVALDIMNSDSNIRDRTEDFQSSISIDDDSEFDDEFPSFEDLQSVKQKLH